VAPVFVTFNPHIHVLAGEGVFGADGTFTVLPAIPSRLLELGFRSQVFKLLVAEGALSEQLAAGMLGWWHSGFSVHNSVRVRAHDADASTPTPNTWTYHPAPDIA